MLASGSLAFGGQACLINGLRRARVGPASALRTTNVVASFVLQASVSHAPVEPVSVVGAIAIAASCVGIMFSSAAKRESGGIAYARAQSADGAVELKAVQREGEAPVSSDDGDRPHGAA